MIATSRAKRDSKPRVIVGGFLGLFPAGGVTWDYLQYVLSLAELGCEVFYLEDTRLWPKYQDHWDGELTAQHNISHLAGVMQEFGLSDRWAYRDEASGECFGMTLAEVQKVCKSADLLINLSCSTCIRDEYLEIPVRALIDTDPMFTQLQCEQEIAFTDGEPAMRGLIDAHTHHFTFGLNLLQPDCLVPDCGIQWTPTLQPISLQHWPVVSAAEKEHAYTTIMNWSVAAPIEYRGRSWGQKNVEFEKVLQMPELVDQSTFAVAVAGAESEQFPSEELSERGWNLQDPLKVAHDWKSYRDYIQQSRGEFSVAKQTYVDANTGWFSCRTACYLASGLPAVVQDTGWSKHLPSESGLLAFTDKEEAAEQLRKVEADYETHCEIAREIAEEFFDGRRVMEKLLKSAGVG